MFYTHLHHSCPQEIRNRKFQSTETLNISETRVDPNITNSMMIHLNDYDLIRKDRWGWSLHLLAQFHEIQTTK